MDVCEADKNVKWFKSDDGIVGSYFLAYLDYFKETKHGDMLIGKNYLF